ncbi:MAG: glycoside hydrolase family 32 protein [Flavobacteriaceae bacterium]|nr:MAG: glycoside hydrolase family 32 protein [Flavobacteriaceae bacterium]
MKYYAFALSSLFLISCQKNKQSSPKPKDMKIDSSFVKTGEQYRPAFHFTPEKNWMNDPNGMVYYQGEYHLFYQYYPKDNVWGPMHWGHAVSKNLIHWERLPIAIYPDSLGYIFSGSAVIDWDNTSGLGSEENPPMVAIYTYHDPVGEKSGIDTFQSQAIAYSLDKGRSWTKYSKNPVISNPGIRDFRDPKVFWYSEKKKWIMTLAVKDHVNFYSSENLKDWKLESEFGQNNGAHGGVWECPDLFSMYDDEGNLKWVLLVSINPNGPQGGSAIQYFVGDFNGSAFLPDHTEIKWVDYGADNYAGVTFSDIPKEDGRRIFIGWMSNWQYAQVVPTETWRSAMTLPRKLALKNNNGVYHLHSKPVREIDTIFESPVDVESNTYQSDSSSYFIEICGELTKGTITLSNGLGESFTITIDKGQLFTDRTYAGKNSFHPEFAKIHKAPMLHDTISKLRLFVDTSSVEMFINDGELVMTELMFPTGSLHTITTKGINRFRFFELKSIWNQ